MHTIGAINTSLHPLAIPASFHWPKDTHRWVFALSISCHHSTFPSLFDTPGYNISEYTNMLTHHIFLSVVWTFELSISVYMLLTAVADTSLSTGMHYNTFPPTLVGMIDIVPTCDDPVLSVYAFQKLAPSAAEPGNMSHFLPAPWVSS